MKILYVTTIGITMNFFKNFIRELLDKGHIVDIATNEESSMVPECYREWGCNIFHISTSRSPLKKDNLDAVKQIKKIVNNNYYDIVHCHTPVAAMCTRLACNNARKNGTRVIYTAHGFHFYKRAPLKNWLLYYPVEKICSYFTDVLITINKEDYELAKKKMKAKQVEYVPGVGIDVAKFANVVVDKEIKRNEINVPRDAFFMLSVGELNHNKNHEVIIRALAEIKDENIHYAIAGKGNLSGYLTSLASELGVGKQVHLLGYRRDIAELYKIADVCVFPSIREGLPVSVMEAMATGLPVTCSKIRGNVDLVDANSGYMFNPNILDECISALKHICSSDLQSIGSYNQQVAQKYDISIINDDMIKIYDTVVIDKS